MIPKETIDKILESCIIEDVVKEHLPDLKKRGTNYWACCPFHEEKTPSFSVSPTKGIYKCFGCGKGGNSINFLMEIGSLSYPEALRELAKKYNIEIPKIELSNEQIQLNNHRESALIITSFANTFFQQNLWDSEEGKIIGLSYLKERGINQENIKRFEIGYSPKERKALITNAEKNSYKLKVLEKAGLTSGEGVATTDKFKNRIIFPIHNYFGKVIGFGGRSMKSNDKVKYLNSPETIIYKKSEVLYGLYFAKSHISKSNKCYLVEGYTDVISMSQAGVKNVVSSSGTSLSIKQINLIKRITNNIVLLFDSDEAGIKASFKHIDSLLKESMNVRIILFPKGEDPDSFAQKNSESDVINYLVNNEKDFIEFKTLMLNQSIDKSPAKVVENIKSIAKSISVIPDKLLRIEYCKLSSSLLQISETDLMEEVNKIKKSYKSPAPKKKSQIIENYSLLYLCEKEIIRIILNYGNQNLNFEDNCERIDDYIYKSLNKDKIIFSNEMFKKIFKEYYQINQKDNFKINDFINHSEQDIQQLCINMLSKKHEISSKWQEIHQIFTQDETSRLEKTVDKALLALKQAFLKNQIEALNQLLNNESLMSNELITKLTKLNKALITVNKQLGRNFNY